MISNNSLFGPNVNMALTGKEDPTDNTMGLKPFLEADNYAGKTGDIGIGQSADIANLDNQIVNQPVDQVNNITTETTTDQVTQDKTKTETGLIESQFNTTQNIDQTLGDPPDGLDPIDPPEDYQFKFFKIDKVKIPKSIRRDLISAYYDADVKALDVFNKIQQELTPKYDEIGKKRFEEWRESKGGLAGLSPEAIMTMSGYIELQKQVEAELQAESMVLFDQRSKDIYANVKKQQDEIVSRLPNIRKIQKIQKRTESLTSPITGGYYYITGADQDFPKVQEMQRLINNEKEKKANGQSYDQKLIDELTPKVDRYFNLIYQTKQQRNPKFDKAVVLDNKWVNPGAVPEYSVNVNDLTEGSRIFTGDGSKTVYFKSDDGTDMFFTLPGKTSNIRNVVITRPLNEAELTLGPDNKPLYLSQENNTSVSQPIGFAGSPWQIQASPEGLMNEMQTRNSYANSIINYGVDPRYVKLVKDESGEEREIESWKVIPSGTYSVYGVKVPQFEIKLGNGLSAVPEFKVETEYQPYLAEVVVTAPLSEAQMQGRIRKNAQLANKMSVAFLQYSYSKLPESERGDHKKLMAYAEKLQDKFDPSILTEGGESSWVNSRGTFLKSLRIGKEGGEWGLPELADKFIRWMVDSGKYNDINEFSPESMFNASIEFFKQEVEAKDKELKSITLSNGMNGQVGLHFVGNAVGEINEQQIKYQQIYNRIGAEIELLDKRIAKEPNNQKLIDRRNSLALTSQNNITRLNNYISERQDLLSLVNEPEFVEASSIQQEKFEFQKKAAQSLNIYKEDLEKKQLSGEAKLAAYEAKGGDILSLLPDEIRAPLRGLQFGFTNRGLSFLNSTFGLASQGASFIFGNPKFSKLVAANTEVRQEVIDQVGKIELPEYNSDGTTNTFNVLFNGGNLVGGGAFDLLSAIAAPEIRALRGTAASATYLSRLPGLFGMWTAGNFYNDYKEAESAGVPKEYRFGHVILKNFVQSAIENIIDVKKFLPKNTGLNITKLYGDAVRPAITKLLNAETRSLGFRELVSSTNNFLKNYFKNVGTFTFEEFMLEENAATLANGIQSTAENIAFDSDLDETMFSLKQQKDNLVLGISLGSMFMVASSARGYGMKKQDKYLHLSQLINEFGTDAVYNTLVDVSNSKTPGVDVGLANEMIELLPYMTSVQKPTGMSDVKWLSIRTFVAQKERLLAEKKSAGESMSAVYDDQIKGIDAKIGEVITMSDDILSKSLHDIGVTAVTRPDGSLYFANQKESAEPTVGATPSAQPGDQALTPTPLTVEQQAIVNQISDLESQKAKDLSSYSQEQLGEVYRPGSSQTVGEYINQKYDPQINQLKSQIPQYATQESQRAQQEGIPEGRVPEYAPAQQGQQRQVQTTQPTAAPSDSDISRQRQVVKTNVSPVVQQIKALANNVEDGATFNPDGTRFTGGGIVVPVASRNTTMEDLSDDAIADFAAEHKRLLDTGNFKIGIYKFPNSNMVSIDLNIVTDRKNLPAALEFAKRAGQESVFDMDNFENIKTGADGMNVRTYNTNQLIRGAADIAQNKVTSAEEFDAIPDIVSAPTATPLKPFTPEDAARMSDAKSMTYDQFSSRYPGTTQQQYDFIKETGYDNQQDYDAWKQSKVDRANQIASDIRDSITNNRNGLTSVDMKNLSIDMQKAWSKIVPGLNLVWDDYERHVEEAGFPDEYKNYAGFFDPNSKVVYLNPDKIGLDTPIHEFGHVWYAVAKIVDPKLIERGRDLIRGTEYEARVRNTPEYAEMSPENIEEEALILAIGEKGAAIIDQMAKRNFMTWLSDLWKLVASKFGVEVEIDNLTLEEFTNLAAMDILAGGGILLTNTSPIEAIQSGVKPSIVSAKRLASKSPEALKRYNTAVDMQSKGLSPDVIWEQTGMENVKGEWMAELNYDVNPSIKVGDLKAYFEQKNISGATFKLGDILSYPEFYKVFNSAKNIVVEIADYKGENWVAAYNPYKDKIYLNLNDVAYNDVEGDYVPAILHEVQHYIQTKEGWPNGTSPTAEFSRARDIISKAERDSGNADIANNISSLDVNGKYSGDAKTLYDKVYAAARFMYHYNFGEVQARNVETRSKYNPETRDKLSPVSTQDKFPKRSVSSSKQIGVNEKKAVSDVMQSKDYAKSMTEDKDNYYFFHWSNDQRKIIDPNKFGNNRITSREERIARPSAAFFYTRPDFQEMGVGSYGHVVAIPKDKVYPATADPLNFFDEAKALFEKSHPGMAFGPNQQIGWITKVANSKGYEMVVAKWGKQLRAETTNKVKPEWYQMPDGWGIKTNTKYANLKRGFNETVGTGKIKAQPKSGIPISFNAENRIPGMAENIKRASINDFSGKEAVLISSDRLTTGLVDYNGFKKPHRKLGGIFYAAANKGYIWASSTANKAQSIINDIVYDEEGFGHIAIMAMAGDSHMSNYNSILFVSDILKTLKVPSTVIAERVNRASRRATGQDIVSKGDSVSKISEKINKYFSVESARFDARKPFLESLLGNTKSGINEIGMPDFKSISERLSEPSLAGLRNGTVVAIMRFKGKPTVAETSASNDGEVYHQSYPFAIKAQGDVEVFLLDQAYGVEQILPEFINRGGKKISYSDAEAIYGTQAPARYTRNIFLSQPTARLSVSSRFGLEDGWATKAVEEAYDMLRGGIFSIKDNASGGVDLIYNGGTIESGVTQKQAEDVRDDMIKRAIMKGYPQISEMTADNILLNAKRKNISKRIGKKPVEGNIGEFNVTGFNNRTKSTPKKIRDGIKRWFVRNFTVSQGAPKWMVRLKESRVGNVSYMVSRAEGIVKDMKKTAKKIGFEDWTTFDAALRNYRPHTPSNPYWTGGEQGFSPSNTQSPEFLALPSEMKRYIISMRATIDGMSEQLVRNGLVSPDLALTLEENMGKYVHRSYALYTIGQKWADQLKSKNKTWQTDKEGDDIIQTAKYNLVQLYAGHIMSTNPGLSLEEVTDMANRAADVEIESILQSKTPVLGSDENSFLPYRNTGSLQQRQEVPDWLRKLLGEFTDPGTAFLLSVSEASTLLHTSAYLAKVRDNGLGTVFFEEGNRPQEASVRISSQGKLLKPLDGLYTTPEMHQILMEADKNLRHGWPLMLKVMNINKMMKTIYSPVTQMKNFGSNAFFAINNGHFDVTRMGVAYKYFKGQIVNKQTEALLERLKPLFVRGVLNQSLTARELNEMFKMDDFEQYVLDNAEKDGGFNAGRAVRKFGRGASRIYQASDDFWKIFAYYNEQQDLSKALFNKGYDELSATEKDEVDNESAERVMNTYPTYDRVLGIFKGLSRAAVFGNFIAFRAESFRVFGNTIAYAYNDIAKGIKEKNPRRVALGSKRLIGMAAYNAIRMEGVYWGAKYAGLGVSGVISSIWGALFGGDDEDEERQAINSWTPTWSKSADKIYDAKQAKDGKLTFYPLGSIDPYAGIYNIFNAYKFGNEYDEDGGIVAAGLEIVAPFLEPEMVIDNTMSAVKNKDQYGWQIYNEGDDAFMQFIQGTGYVAKKSLIPGAYTWIERMFTSRDEEGNKVYGFNPEELYLAPIGRFYNVDMSRTWKAKLYNTKNVIFTQIDNEFKKEKKNGGSFADQANYKWNREILRLHKMYKDGLALGFPEEKLIGILKEAKMEARVLEAIITGETYRAYDNEGKLTNERLNEMIMRGEIEPPTPKGSIIDNKYVPADKQVSPASVLPKGDF